MATLQPGEKARMYALGKIARGGATRGGYVDGRVYIDYGGQDIGWAPDNEAQGVLLGTLTITDALDEAPNTCSFRVNGAVPRDGAEVIITRGSKNSLNRLFAGYALTVQQSYAGVPRNVQADVSAVDYTWLLGMRKVTGQYRTLSATAIVQDLVSRFAGDNGFTTTAVAAGLPVLDVVTFTNEDLPAAITRVARRIGASWYVDYQKGVHVWIGTEPQRPPPEPLTPTHKSLANLSFPRERTQGLTRVLVEGRGSRLLAAVPPNETIVPLEAVDMFEALPDVFLKLSYQGGDSARHLTFTGVVPSGGGTLVGPGVAPSSGPTLAYATGGAVDVGTHDYAYTWVTAAGETKPSPLVRAAVTTVPTPPPLLQMAHQDDPVNPGVTGAWLPGDYVEFAYSYSLVNNFSGSGPISPVRGLTAIPATNRYYGTAPGSNAQAFYLSFQPTPNTPAGWIVPWHRVNGGPWRAWNVNIQNSSLYAWPQMTAKYPENSQPATPPAVAPVVQTVNVSGIATGPAAVTGRKLYRTKANLSALQLVTTLANNTATTYTDAAADTTLGAAAPVGDTSGLQVPEGTVNAGASSCIVASTGPFRSLGGWAVAGEQAIRYSGYAGGALQGIPPTGPGALVGPIQYNTSIRAAPLLTGIPATGDRSIETFLSAGDEVYLVVQVDDLARQGQLAADLGVPNGIREEWVQDRRLSIAEARARGQATLNVRPLVEVTAEYTCRDQRTAAGLNCRIDLPAPTSIAGDFKIQQVVWSNFRPRPEQPPTARVTASTRHFTFEEWLRLLRTKE